MSPLNYEMQFNINNNELFYELQQLFSYHQPVITTINRS